MPAPNTVKHWDVEWGGGLILGPLSGDLYRDPGQCVIELVRNGMVACMRDDDAWDPSRIHVEIEIVSRHPLTGGDALVVMDAGSGFTPGDRKRFCTIGTTVDDLDSTRHGGAAQKRIGRLACFALMRTPGPDSAFYLLTRTSQDGPWQLVEITPRALQNRKVVVRDIPPDATELGRFRNYRGRGSMFVIPEPKIRTNDELRDEIAPYLPRKRELCGTIKIGGQTIDPPPLASGVIVTPSDAEVEAYLERAAHGTRGGISLADLKTGFRVGFCPTLTAYLPYPLGRTDLSGEIFLPGLLAQQETSRGGLRGTFLGKPDHPSRAWRRIVELLLERVAGPARGLLDDADVMSGTSLGRLIVGDVADLFSRTWGDPEGRAPSINGICGVLTPDGGGGGGHRGPKNPPGPRKPSGPRKPRVTPIKIGDETWWVGVAHDEEDVFASANDDAKTIMVNGGYDAIPRSKPARMEHTVLALLGAVGRAKHPYDTGLAQLFVTARRREALKKQND